MFYRRPAAIIDMDGTLVNVSGIRHHVAPVDSDGNYKSKNFDDFHTAAINCPPILSTIDLVKDLKAEGLDILIVTARSQRYGRQTAFWLAMHGVPSDAMIMRREGDMRKDVLVKAEMLKYNILPWWDPQHAVDDNPNVYDLWTSNCIKTTVVPGWVDL